MKHVAIYMEGGGDRAAGKAALRQGMDALLQPLKELARSHALRWKLVACGGRDRAFRAFGKAAGDDDALVVLLVDSEGPVSASAVAHLAQRDGWDLRWADEDAIHLMVQVMETWSSPTWTHWRNTTDVDSDPISYLVVKIWRKSRRRALRWL